MRINGYVIICMMSENVHLKVLIPSHAAGSIIGKGGETICNLQSATETNIQMSRGLDYYPG